MGGGEFALGVTAGVAVGIAGAYAAYLKWGKPAPKPRVNKRASIDASYMSGPTPAQIAELRELDPDNQPAGKKLESEHAMEGEALPDDPKARLGWAAAHARLHEQFAKKHPKGFGCEPIVLPSIKLDSVFVLPVPHLSEYYKDSATQNKMGLSSDEELQRSYNQLMGAEDVVVKDIIRKPNSDSITTAFLRAGPRRTLHFEPSRVRAAIVTCGGLCPGLNNIIQGVTRTLLDLYGAEKVLGVRGGYQGFSDPAMAPFDLTMQTVRGIHHRGGTMIGSGRGSFDLDKTIAWLKHHRINQLYIVGGDGTHRAGTKVADEARRLKLDIAVIGVPKTIDNDIDLLDRSFGFNTAVEEAQKAIRSAQVEAKCNLPNGIGIVKLMGRHSGFIAVHATMSSGEVDLCLVPEVPVVTEGPTGCLPHLERVVAKKGYAVVVVAEGAGEEILGQSATTDAGGNRKLPELGVWLKDEIGKYFKKQNKPVTVKYIDPSYMIRSVQANTSDAIYCLLLAQNAVHGAMAGYTAFSVGMCNNRLVYIPICALVKNSPRMMDARGRTWERVLSVTGQPNTMTAAKGGDSGAVTSKSAF